MIKLLEKQNAKVFAASLIEKIGRLIYPPHCVSCNHPNSEDEDRYLCRKCIQNIDFVREPTCSKCGHELGPYVEEEGRCLNCRNVPLRFDRAIAAAHHRGVARQLALALKFQHRRENALPLGKLLATRLFETDIIEEVQTIMPIPLHKQRVRMRGYNQAELIAEELARLTGLPMSNENLYRKINTPPQARGMSAASRRANVKGAFDIHKPEAVEKRTVLVIDDVMTTGATASECAATLKNAGAAKVYVATVTRVMLTPPRDDDAPIPEDSPELTAMPELMDG